MPSRKPSRVREPIQVYLSPADRAMLDRVAKASGLSRAEVLRRGIRRMATSAEEHPGLSFLKELAAGPWPDDTPTDLAARHDYYLTEQYSEEARRRGGK